MANTKSARRSARKSVERRTHNVALRTSLRTAVKNVEKAIAAGKKDAAEAALQKSRSTIDRVAAKGIVHRNTAARYKSRLAHAIKAMQ